MTKGQALPDQLSGHQRKKSTKDSLSVVLAKIQQDIRDGHLSPGQRLKENELAARYDSGRGAVREAIRYLAGDGIVELSPNRGARMRHLTTTDLVNIIQALSALAKPAFEAIVGRFREPGVAYRLNKAMQEIREAGETREYYTLLLAITDYHMLINDLSGNPYLNFLWSKLHTDFYHRELSSKLRVEHWGRYIENYQEMTDAILAGDLEALESCNRRHADELIGPLLASEPVF